MWIAGIEHRLQCVDRTGADITEHNPECAHDNPGAQALRRGMRRRGDFGGH
jgi:hypothetical protein